MHTENHLTMRSTVERVFAVASAVENWPQFLPHYRWVTVLSTNGHERVVQMAAHRDGFPVRWTARQRLDHDRYQIHFTHIRGISRGMEVTWFLDVDGPLVHVRIVHDLTLHWPLIGALVAQHIIGKLFVHHIATKTLQRMKTYIETPDALPHAPQT